MENEYRDEVFDDFETYVKAHQTAVEKLMDLEHVPRYIRLMELKAIIRALQKITIEVETISNFLDRAHQVTHKPI